MKILSAITLIALASMLLGAVIKESKEGQSIEFYTNESGTVEKKAEITAAGKMKVNQIEDLAGGTPPGMVPLGGMIAVMPTVDASAWQPPTSGAIKDGFMRADGHQITSGNVSAGCKFAEGTYLPNMVAMVARGGTASCDGSVACNTKAGGNDSVTPSGTVSQPTFAGAATSRGNWFKDEAITATFGGNAESKSNFFKDEAVSATFGGNAESKSNFFKDEAVSATFGGSPTSYSVSVPGHSHGKGNLNITSSGGHVHNVSSPRSGSGYTVKNLADSGDATSGLDPFTGFNWNIYVQSTGSDHTHGSSNFSGSVGNTGGSNGDGAFTASGTNTPSGSVTMDTSDDNKQEWAATGSYTPSGSVTMDTSDDNKQEWAATGSYTPSGSVTMDASDDNKQEWAATGTYTPTGTVSQPTFSGNSQDNLPNYQNVVWVIRVY